MSVSALLANQSTTPRKPLESQRGLGGDMSMMFFVRTQIPEKFASSLQQQIKGLNYETIAGVHFPKPDWITTPEYAALSDPDDNSPNWKSFSLNFSRYNSQPISEDDWSNKWFFMYGRVHPYAMTWELQPYDGSEDGHIPQDYTIPALIIRDQGYQPLVCHRLLLHVSGFELITQYRSSNV